MPEKIKNLLMKSNPTQQAVNASNVYRDYYEEFIKEFGNSSTKINPTCVFFYFNTLSTIWFHLKDAIDAKKINDDIKKILHSGEDNKNTLSEMEARLILSHYGYNNYKVKEGHRQRRPDIITTINEKIVEIEVTKADHKKDKTKCQNTCQIILEKINNVLSENLFIYIKDQEIDTDMAVTYINQTQTIHNDDQICIIKYSENDDKMKNLISEIKNKISNAFIGVNQYTIPTKLKIEINIEISEKSYNNTIDDKFRNPQSTGKHPFIIFYDASNLPNSYNVLKDYIFRKMKSNPEISGVLIYSIGHTPGIYPRLNKLAFFRNETAIHATPPEFLSEIDENRNEMIINS